MDIIHQAKSHVSEGPKFNRGMWAHNLASFPLSTYLLTKIKFKSVNNTQRKRRFYVFSIWLKHKPFIFK